MSLRFAEGPVMNGLNSAQDLECVSSTPYGQKELKGPQESESISGEALGWGMFSQGKGEHGNLASRSGSFLASME